MNQAKPQDNRGTLRSGIGFVVFLARMMAASVEVFLHKPRTFGDRYLSIQAAAALLLIFFWPAFCNPTHDPMPMIIFDLLYVGMCAGVRGQTINRARRGEPEPHSRYNGTPRLMRFTGKMDEVKVKCTVEPLFTFFIGSLVTALSPPLGGYLMCASLALAISNGVADACERQRARDMYDAYVSQRNAVERLHELRRD